ncbi:hypothetical protein GTR04_6323 [Trichophyton interdigitale]|nr:hypothetical protein GY631_5330 [Trichophyton interdigitale]KAG8206299.1 hypothetical protein GTR04_6323 [Trichophyton interdigitale]
MITDLTGSSRQVREVVRCLPLQSRKASGVAAGEVEDAGQVDLSYSRLAAKFWSQLQGTQQQPRPLVLLLQLVTGHITECCLNIEMQLSTLPYSWRRKGHSTHNNAQPSSSIIIIIIIMAPQSFSRP